MNISHIHVNDEKKRDKNKFSFTTSDICVQLFVRANIVIHLLLLIPAFTDGKKKKKINKF